MSHHQNGPRLRWPAEERSQPKNLPPKSLRQAMQYMMIKKWTKWQAVIRWVNEVRSMTHCKWTPASSPRDFHRQITFHFMWVSQFICSYPSDSGAIVMFSRRSYNIVITDSINPEKCNSPGFGWCLNEQQHAMTCAMC